MTGGGWHLISCRCHVPTISLRLLPCSCSPDHFSLFKIAHVSNIHPNDMLIFPCNIGRGSHNSLYRLAFSDSTECAASISNSPPQFFSQQIKLSEIATMQYLYSSPLYNIPIPEVYAWDLSFDNPVGAPYVLREVSPGKNMAEDGKFYRLSSQDKMKVIKELALVQAELSKPSEFDKIGSIYRRGDGEDGFYVGEIISAACMGEDYAGERGPSKGPYSSMPELWQSRLERETLLAIHNWSSLSSDSAISSQSPPSLANPQHFGEVLQLLSGLTNLFAPPKELATLCIHHSDLAIRNVLFDEKTLKITGVIDWEFACVVPLVITGRFPNDLGWEGNEFARSLGRLGDNGEVWNHHYYDWTSLEGVTPPPPPRTSSLSLLDAGSAYETNQMEDYLSNHYTTSMNSFSDDSGALMNEPDIPSPPSPPLPPPPTSRTSQRDLDVRASRLVELFYLRKYYASCVASRDFALTRLFIDSVAYIKFNELVMGGSEKWFSGVEWIREVFWRLKSLEETQVESLRRGKAVVKVPEIFSEKVERGVVDLGNWEEKFKGRTPV